MAGPRGAHPVCGDRRLWIGPPMKPELASRPACHCRAERTEPCSAWGGHDAQIDVVNRYVGRVSQGTVLNSGSHAKDCPTSNTVCVKSVCPLRQDGPLMPGSSLTRTERGLRVTLCLTTFHSVDGTRQMPSARLPLPARNARRGQTGLRSSGSSRRQTRHPQAGNTSTS